MASNLELPFFERYMAYLKNSQNTSEDVILSNISEMHSKFVRAIISELVASLLILNHGKVNLRPAPHVTLSERYRNEYREKQFDEETLEPMAKALQRMTSVKLDNEIELLRLTLVELINELESSLTFPDFQTKIDEFLHDAKTEYNFIKNFVSNKDRVTELKSKLKQKKDNGEKMLKDLNDDIMNVESHIYDIQIQNDLKFRLVWKWEQTRHEQAATFLSLEEKKLTEICDEYKVKLEREQIAINDIQNFLKFQINDLSQQVEYWIERYDKETKELDVEIAQLKEAIQDVKLKNEDVTGKYDLRQIDINEYREEQRILEEKRKLEEKQCISAIRIQSWWRGVMVRMELGPYRPKKKNKKGGKKK